MPDPLLIVDTSEIQTGRLDDVRTAFRDLAAFVEREEPRALAYEVYVSADGRRVTVIQLHPDAAVAEAHMQIAGQEFAKFRDLLTLIDIDVYGAPSEALLARLHAKANLLGGAPLTVHEHQAGFIRLPGAS